MAWHIHIHGETCHFQLVFDVASVFSKSILLSWREITDTHAQSRTQGLDPPASEDQDPGYEVGAKRTYIYKYFE
jgi:hypothetical protein